MNTQPGDWQRLLDTLKQQVSRSAAGDPHLFPHFSEHGKWQLLAADRVSRWHGNDYDHGNWTLGFWFGVMWLASALTGEETAANLARDRLGFLAPRARDRTTHDLGFIFWPSLVLGQRLAFLTDAQTEPALRAAETLADRFNRHGDYIQAFGEIGDPRGAGTSTIDTMMNLPLLWWAGTSTGDDRLLEVARRHAVRSSETFVREDGSTYHLNHFDPTTGALLEQGTFQGAGSTSCWSRGQAWAICGFALAYAATGDPRLLDASQRTAGYFWDHLPDDLTPPWDFVDHSRDTPRDTSAAAVAALGALVLAAVHPQEGQRGTYESNARDLLTALLKHVDPADDVDGILQRSSYSVPQRLGMDGATAWGDFYLTLASAMAAKRLPVAVILDGPRRAEALA